MIFFCPLVSDLHHVTSRCFKILQTFFHLANFVNGWMKLVLKKWNIVATYQLLQHLKIIYIMRHTIRWKNRGYHLPAIEIKTAKEKQLSEEKNSASHIYWILFPNKVFCNTSYIASLLFYYSVFPDGCFIPIRCNLQKY